MEKSKGKTNSARKHRETERRIRVNDHTYNSQFNYANNYIKTSKYTLITFLPLNLLEQFQRLANFYFLCLMVLQMISVISSLTPITTSIPLIGVLTLTAIKDAYDDYLRHESDKKVNNRKSKAVRNGHVVDVTWSDVHVGDLIFMQEGHFVAADVLILSTSEPNGLCFIETAELDGETNLKSRQCLPETSVLGHNVTNFNGEIVYEAPNNHLNKFSGVMLWQGKQYLLDNDRIVLRGCVLRNTEWCYGVVLYAGKDTKLMQNSGKSVFKRTTIDRLLNFVIVGIVLFLLSICLFCAIACAIWEAQVGQYFQTYLPWDSIIPTSSPYVGATVIGILVFFSYAIVLNTLVPISLYVSVEVIRFVQSILINADQEMYCPVSNSSAQARTTTLNEELGQIQYIFSDKTGTLTQNIMTFNKCSINGVVYGEEDGDIGTGTAASSHHHHNTQDVIINNNTTKSTNTSHCRNTNNHNHRQLIYYRSIPQMATKSHTTKSKTESSDGKIDFSWNNEYEKTFVWKDSKLLRAVVDENNHAVRKFFTLLALCHTVMPNAKSDVLEYQAQSPDEAALVSAARNFGVVFRERTPSSITIEVMGKKEVYKLLCILDFNNNRKRMSVIVEHNDHIQLFCKGADSVIYERLSQGNEPLKYKTLKHLNDFASDGLRTLCLAYRDIDEASFYSWKRRHHEASMSSESRDEKLDAICDEIEKDMTLLGVTAIEDKLQEGVAQTIANLLLAGIHIWMLTGDKQETAINVGYSCQLLQDDMELLILDGYTHDQVQEQLHNCFNAINDNKSLSSNNKALNNGLPLSVPMPVPNEHVLHFSERVEEIGIGSDDENDKTTCYALVVNGHSLVHAFHSDLQKLFIDLCTKCKAVIACRMTPLQKATVIELIKKYQKAVTLAIGDGANDVSMIRAAHVGVGISGQEGNQAVLSSDYSIGQFRFLQRLLLVHGRWSYYRMSKFLRYFFYKNFVFTLCHFWFAFFCGFSAQTVFDPMYISVYNLFYTSLPVLAIGILDQDVNDENSLLYPQLYTPGIQNLLFNKWEFLRSALMGFFASAVLFLVPYGSHIYGASQDGHTLSDYMVLSNMVSTILVFAVTFQVMLDTAYWTIFNHIVIWSSLVIYFVTTYVYNNFLGGSYVGSMSNAMMQPSFWLTLVLVVTILLVPVVAWRFYFVNFRPTLSDRVRLKQRIDKKRSKESAETPKTPSARHKRRSIRSGYAFAHQEGFGRLITSGKIMRSTAMFTNGQNNPSNDNNNTRNSKEDTEEATTPVIPVYLP